MNSACTHALAEGIATLVITGGFSIIGIAGCWMGLKVSQVCKQKEGSFPQDSYKKTAYKIGEVVSTICTAFLACLTSMISIEGGLLFGARMWVVIVNSSPLTSLRVPAWITLTILGIAGLSVPTTSCLSKLFDHYGFLSPRRT